MRVLRRLVEPADLDGSIELLELGFTASNKIYLVYFDGIVEGKARMLGISIGKRAAADVLAKHTDDIGTIEPYRPLTTPGAYVPTTFPLGYAFAQHRPWVMTSAAQFRPGPPPAVCAPFGTSSSK